MKSVWLWNAVALYLLCSIATVVRSGSSDGFWRARDTKTALSFLENESSSSLSEAALEAPPMVPLSLIQGADSKGAVCLDGTLPGYHLDRGSGLGVNSCLIRHKDPREEVIQAWYMDDSEEDQRLPHHKYPKEFVSLEKLAELGVISWRLDADNYETDEEVKKIREAGGYSYMDFCEVCPEKLQNYEEKVKSFFEEHLHIDEEIRYCVSGSGYFDVRGRNEAWIRVWVKKGGMILFPAGIYHRFTVDSENYIKAMRLFAGDPVWTPYNRPHDHLPARKEYVNKFVKEAINASA